jgi:hypothetical protein
VRIFSGERHQHGIRSGEAQVVADCNWEAIAVVIGVKYAWPRARLAMQLAFRAAGFAEVEEESRQDSNDSMTTKVQRE